MLDLDVPSSPCCPVFTGYVHILKRTKSEAQLTLNTSLYDYANLCFAPQLLCWQAYVLQSLPAEV